MNYYGASKPFIKTVGMVGALSKGLTPAAKKRFHLKKLSSLHETNIVNLRLTRSGMWKPGFKARNREPVTINNHELINKTLNRFTCVQITK